MAEVTLPQLGETVTEGTITQWFKKVGDQVAADDPLFEVSTDKVDTEVPSPIDGVLIEIRVPAGETVAVGTVVAVVGAASTPVVEAPPAPTPAPAPAPAPDPSPAPAPTPAPAPALAGTGDPRLLSPVVRRLVNEHGIDPSSIIGTGPGGRITRDDVLGYIDTLSSSRTAPVLVAPAVYTTGFDVPMSRPAAAPSTPTLAPALPKSGGGGEGRETSVRLSKIRRLTGDHMVMSKSTSPHAFSVVEVDFANVDVARNASKEAFKAAEGFSLTYLPFIARAIVDGLREFPNLNASVSDGELIVHNYIDLGIAVDLDFEGLLAPVVRDAESKRLRALAREISDLANRARTRKLSPDEIQGGTFTISNNGSAGSVLTMPIINQPQVGIISTDAIVRRAVVARMADGSEAIVIHPVGNLAMSWDHRAFDGAYAAGFLKRVKEILESRDWNAEL